MKHGCMVVTLRQSSSRCSGSRQIHRCRKKRVKLAAMSSPCLIFWHPRNCLQEIRTLWSNRQWQVLLRGFEAAEGGHSAQTSRQVEKKQLVFPLWQSACSHITRFSTIPDFQNITMIDSPIHLTMPPVTFSYSPRWNYGWKGVVLTWLRRSMQNRKRLSTHLHLRTSRNAWNRGKHAGIAVYMRKGTTSNETVETRSYGKKLFLWLKSPKFWVAPRMYIYIYIYIVCIIYNYFQKSSTLGKQFWTNVQNISLFSMVLLPLWWLTLPILKNRKW
jgi:hypothetical protein